MNEPLPLPPRSSVRRQTVTVGLLPNLMSVLRGNNELDKKRKSAICEESDVNETQDHDTTLHTLTTHLPDSPARFWTCSCTQLFQFEEDAVAHLADHR